MEECRLPIRKKRADEIPAKDLQRLLINPKATVIVDGISCRLSNDWSRAGIDPTDSSLTFHPDAAGRFRLNIDCDEECNCAHKYSKDVIVEFNDISTLEANDTTIIKNNIMIGPHTLTMGTPVIVCKKQYNNRLNHYGKKVLRCHAVKMIEQHPVCLTCSSFPPNQLWNNDNNECVDCCVVSFEPYCYECKCV